ncbi:MAG: sialate O-acetylesterase [Opitutaceae bacterium]|jgi:sialate O-acetylesterase
MAGKDIPGKYEDLEKMTDHAFSPSNDSILRNIACRCLPDGEAHPMSRNGDALRRTESKINQAGLTMRMKRWNVGILQAVVLWAVGLSSSAWAEVKFNSLFTDGAVLQQEANVPVWGTAGEGEKVTVQFDGQSATATAKDGKWMVHLKPHKAGGPFELTVAGEANTITLKNVLVGEVWVCSGQSNMQFGLRFDANAATEIPTANYPKLRLFFVERKNAAHPLAEVKGGWSECSPESAKYFTAVGYYFGRNLHKTLGVPVGLIHSSYGATYAQAWTSLDGLEKEPTLQRYSEQVKKLAANYEQASATYPGELAVYKEKLKQWDADVGVAYKETLKAWTAENQKLELEGKPAIPEPKPAQPKPTAPTSPEGPPNTPTTLFNAMIAPLIPYAIKGVIWYQGENNAGNPTEYRTLFPRLISDWREKWGQGDFPFLFVQIAPYRNLPPGIREAQLLTWQKTPNTAMAVITDVGDATDIHPKQKEPVGARLALAARALAYGEKIEYSGPVFDELKIDGDRAVLSFKHIGSGLLAKDGDLKGFTIAGANKKFVAAKAVIEGDTVVVSSDAVREPVSVRYGWANVPDVNLYNKEGLPASPFRTDVP